MARKVRGEKKKKKRDKGMLEREIYRLIQVMAKEAINAALEEVMKG